MAEQDRGSVEALDVGIDSVSFLIGDFGLLVTGYMIHPERPTQHLGSVEIVDRKDGGTLILVHEESEAAMFAFAHGRFRRLRGRSRPGISIIVVLAAVSVGGVGVGVGTWKINIDDFSKLRKDGDDIAFGEIVG